MQYKTEEEILKNKNKIKEIVNFIENINLLNILKETDIFSDDKKTNNYFTIDSIDKKSEPLTCYLMVIHFTDRTENLYIPADVRHILVLETNNQAINEDIEINNWRKAGEYEEVDWNFWDKEEYMQKLKYILSDYIIPDDYEKAIKTIWNGISGRVNKLYEEANFKHIVSKDLIGKYSKI